MILKVTTLYLVSIASPLIAAYQFAPLNGDAIFQASAKNTIISQQMVNRSVKSDKMQIRRATPESDVRQFFLPPPISDRKTDSGCKPPIDVPGRCFA